MLRLMTSGFKGIRGAVIADASDVTRQRDATSHEKEEVPAEEWKRSKKRHDTKRKGWQKRHDTKRKGWQKQRDS